MSELNTVEKRAVKTRFNRRMSAKAAHSMLLGLYVQRKPIILEVGCGQAPALFEAVELLKPSLAIGLDIDREMLAAAERMAATRRLKFIKLIHGPAENLPIAPQSMDLVIGFEVLHHVDDWKLAISEVARVLKPGGHFLSRETINPTRAPWLGGMVHRIPRSLTWPTFFELTRKSGLSPVEAHHSSLHAESIFIKD